MTLERATPASQGVSAGSVMNMLDRFKSDEVGFHSIMILRHGKVIAEGFRSPYRPEYSHTLFSLSKSFTSTAIGFAANEGLLKVEDKVISFFPELLPCKPCENMQEMTIHNLLTMSTGHSAEPYDAVFKMSGKWEEAFLRSYVDLKPGTWFAYNTPATFMLSAIIQRVSGQKLVDYLKPRLFEPLGIDNPVWEENPDGVSCGGFGLRLKTEDIAKFGLFLQNKGVYDGKQLLNSEWIDTASSKQVENYGERDWGSGYGYQFWQCSPEGVYRGDGAFGQLCIVDNKNDIVVAVTAGTADMKAELNDIFDSLLVNLSDKPIIDLDEEKKQAELLKRLSSLEIPAPKGDKRPASRLVENQSYSVSPGNNNFPIHYSFAGNKLNIESFSFSFLNTNKPCVTLTIGNNEYKLPLGYEGYLEGTTPFGRTECAYAFDGETLYIKLIFVETPFIYDISFDFLDNAAVLSVKNPILGEMNMTAFCLLR